MGSQGYTYLIQVDTNGNAVLPQLANNANKADASLRKVGKDAKGRFNNLKHGVEGVNTSLRGVGKSAEAGFSNLNRNIRSSSNMMSKLRGMAAGLGLTLSAGMVASSVIGIGAGFEKSMSNVQALSNATATEMVSLKKAARDAGASTAFTARESADAMGYLALAGYKANQQIVALPATLDLAAAGSIGLARSADIATNILSQYRMNAKDTNVVVDQLAFTQSRFNTNIEEASDAMNYFGPTAAAMKISLSESNATIGLLANNGLKGSLATRALGTSIVRLTKPTKSMSELMKQLNIDFFDSKGQFVGMAGMVDILQKKTEGMTDKQKQSALATLFGAEAIQEINILMAEGADKIKYWTGELDNATGTAKRMADTKLDNLAGDFQILKSSSQEVALSIYDEIGPTLRAVTKEATLFIRSMDTKKVGAALNNLIVGLRDVGKFLAEHKNEVIALAKIYVSYRATMLVFNKTQGLSAIGFGKMTKGANLFRIGLNSIKNALRTNPLGILLTAVTAGISLFQMFKTRTKEVSLVTQQNIASINQQRNKVRQLSDELSNSMTPLQRRKEIIEELRNIDARLVEGLDAQNISYGKLTDNVERYNREQVKRIMIERKKGEIEKMFSASADAKEKEFAAQDLTGRAFETIRNRIRNDKKLSDTEKMKQLSFLSDGVNRETIMRMLAKNYQGGAGNRVQLNAAFEKKGLKSRVYEDSYYDLAKGYNDLREARQMADKAEFRASDFSKQANKEINRISSSLNAFDNPQKKKETGGLSGSTYSGGIGTGTSENIISGGAQQKVINIKIEKFQDAINFNIQGQLDELKNSMDEMRALVNEQFMRVLNSANQITN